jgi:ABC-type transporter Mla subunit MlaD
MDLNVYLHDGPAIKVTLARIVHAITLLTTQGAKIMATGQEVSDKLDALTTAIGTTASDVTTALNDLAAEVAALKTQGGATPAELDAILGKISPMLATMTTLDAAAKAADPGTPAP